MVKSDSKDGTVLHIENANLSSEGGSMWKVGDRVMHLREKREGVVEFIGPVDVYGRYYSNGLKVRWDDTGLATQYGPYSDRIVKCDPKYELKEGMYVYHKDAPHLGRGEVREVATGLNGRWKALIHWSMGTSTKYRMYEIPSTVIIPAYTQKENDMNRKGLLFDSTRMTNYLELSNPNQMYSWGYNTGVWVVVACDGHAPGPQRGYVDESVARRVAEEMAEKYQKPFVWCKVKGWTRPQPRVDTCTFH